MLHPASSRSAPRRGKTLVLFVLLLPALLGMTGLVVDGGVLLAASRQAQNAADAAALAAALQKFKGAPDATALAAANSFLSNNGLSGVSLTLNAGSSNALNIPPQDPTSTGSPYKGTSNYVEVLITKPVTTLFIQVLGVNKSQSVTARAVAGFEPVGNGEGAIVLDPNASPGISINNSNARLVVKGTLVVNSQGQGKDQYGNTVGTKPPNQPAITTNGNVLTPAPIVAQDVQVVGGVDNLDNIRAYDAAFSANGYYYDTSNIDRPLFAGVPIAPDPLGSLATPTTSTGVNSTTGSYVLNGTTFNATFLSPASVSVGNGDTATFSPGIYTNINVTGGTVTFNSGIYVLLGSNNGGLTVNGGTVNTVANGGVMFYNTGSNYNPSTGAPDSSDGNSSVGNTSGVKFGSISVNGGTVNLSPLSDATSPFNGMLFYQRRWNTQTLRVGGNSNNVNLTGTVYAKWANFQLAGQGKYNAQFLVGSMAISGNATVTINANGKEFGKANLVFLVE